MAVIALLAALLTLLLHGYRVGSAPDVFSDEGLYLTVGINLARGLGLTINHNIFLWHPPIFMLAEAAYIRLAGLTYADPLTTLLSLRNLNVFFSACTAALLVLFGYKLHSRGAGLTIAALFIMDPYVQRINRRNMLETLTLLFLLLGLYLFFSHRPHLPGWQRIAAGVAFGLMLLTKEAVGLELLALVLYVVCFRRSQLRDAAWVIAIACLVYLIYPAWAIAIGVGNQYLAYKLFGVTRILSLVTGHTPAPPSGTVLPAASKPTFLEAIWTRLAQYGMSYVLIALAATLTLVLLLHFRQRLAASYIGSLFIFSLGFGLVLGVISDQYSYFLIVPSTIVVGYTLTVLFEVARSRLPGAVERLKLLWLSISCKTAARLLLAALSLILLYNSYVWVQTYALGNDDGYIKTIEYISTHIPAGETIVASDDVTNYLLPAYNVRFDRDPQAVTSRRVCYFIMSSKDAQSGYDSMTPAFYEWVLHHSHPLLQQDDASFWKIGLYQREGGQCGAALQKGDTK